MKPSLMAIILARRVLAQPVDPSKLHAPVAPISTFKSTCFSGVCLGDDLNKIGGLKITWLSEANRNTGYLYVTVETSESLRGASRNLKQQMEES